MKAMTPTTGLLKGSILETFLSVMSFLPMDVVFQSRYVFAYKQ